jgi:hypothetical protein
MWFLCKEIYKTTPDDPRIVNMNPVLRLWMYENWIADKIENIDLAKNHAYLLGSFWNPEAVRKLIEEGTTFESTDEELEESLNIVKAARNKKLPSRRRVLKE